MSVWRPAVFHKVRRLLSACPFVCMFVFWHRCGFCLIPTTWCKCKGLLTYLFTVPHGLEFRELKVPNMAGYGTMRQHKNQHNPSRSEKARPTVPKIQPDPNRPSQLTMGVLSVDRASQHVEHLSTYMQRLWVTFGILSTSCSWILSNFVSDHYFVNLISWLVSELRATSVM